MVDPATAAIVAGALAKGVGGLFSSRSNKRRAKKNAKRSAKEMKRETYADLINEALSRSAELEGHRMKSGEKLSKGKTRSLQDSSDLLREAFKI